MGEHYTQYFDHHAALLKEFKASIQHLPPYRIDLADMTETDYALMRVLDELCEQTQQSEMMSEKGQWLVERVVSGYNQLLPYLSRDLLWFFGGSCLHFMPEGEINFYQQLDELRYAAEEQDRAFDFNEAKQYLINTRQDI